MSATIDQRFNWLENCQRVHRADYPGIYFLCQGATVVYVGKAKNIACRIKAHFGEKDFDTVMAMRVPLEFAARTSMRLRRPSRSRRLKQLAKQLAKRFSYGTGWLLAWNVSVN
jgi:hypothetical protein